eukprot:103994_1
MSHLRFETESLVPKPSTSRVVGCRTKYIIATIVFLIIVIITVLIYLYVFDESSSETINIGLFGEWSVHGGNIQNTQIPSKPNNVILTSKNVNKLTIDCNIESLGVYGSTGSSHEGYINVDDNDNAYFGDLTGFITKINVNTCSIKWRKHIGILLGYSNNTTLAVRNSLALYKNRDGKDLILFGAPNNRGGSTNYGFYEPCWAVIISCDNGDLVAKINMGQGIGMEYCHIHGFMIDYDKTTDTLSAYNGVSSELWGTRRQLFQGRFQKINLDTNELENEWFPISKHLIPANLSDYIRDNPNDYNKTYTGIGIWPFASIYDQYVIFGTADLMTYPDYIGECMLGNFDSIPSEISQHKLSPCTKITGRNLSTDIWWRCLEDGVYPDSLIVLNKNTFEEVLKLPLQGVDAFTSFCDGWGIQNVTKNPGCVVNPGPDADVTRIATFKNKNTNKINTVIAGKSGHFYVVEIPSGNILISRKIGPWSTFGGNTWSLGIDEHNMIAVTTITGGAESGYYLENGDYTCSTGSVHGIDLNSGNLIYQIVNSYGSFEINAYADCNTTDAAHAFDVSVNNGTNCEIGIGINMDNLTENVNVVYPQISEQLPIGSIERAKFYGPLTIANNMIFIPSVTGDIFIHNVTNGEFIHRLECPERNGTFNDDEYNRSGVRNGVTVVKDRVIFYCGAKWNVDVARGNRFVTFKLET